MMEKTLEGPKAAAAPVTAPSAVRQVNIRVVASEGEADCRFWVGLVARGKRPPASLMEIDDIREVLGEAAKGGIAEAGPLMLSDAAHQPPRFVYLMPAPGAELRDRDAWIHAGVQTIKSWQPQAIGFYLAPELVDAPESHELLLAALRELIAAGVASEFYLLIGTYGLNALVNAALRLKREMENDLVNLFVYH